MNLGIIPIPVIGAVVIFIGAVFGTGAAANASAPGDVLFGFDRVLERLEIVLAGNDKARAEVKVKIARERLGELEAENDLADLDEAADEVDKAIDEAEDELGKLEIKFKTKGLTITADQLQVLLEQLQSLLSQQSNLIRKIEVKISDDKIKIKIKTFNEEATRAAELVEDDIEDLEDDDELNASIFRVLEIELKGVLRKVDDNFLLTAGGKTYTLTSQTLNLTPFVDKMVEIRGTGQNSAPTKITVIKIELEDEEIDDEEEREEKLKVEIKVAKTAPKVEAKGFLRKIGAQFVLKDNGKVLFALTSVKVNLDNFVDKFVEVEGFVQGSVLNVVELEVKKTDSQNNPVSPTLPTSNGDSGTSGSEGGGKEDDNGDSGSSGSGSSGSGSSNGENRSGSNSGKD